MIRERPRVLVIRGGAVGDFILTLPAIRLLREHIPGVHLEVLGYAPIVQLAKAGGLAEEVRNLEHGTMARLFAPGTAVDETLADYLRSFNLVVSYLYDPDGYFRGNLEKIGVRTLLEAPHRVESGKGHAAEQLARPLERLAMYLEDPAARLELPTPTAQRPASDEAGLLALHPGSGSLRKNWAAEHWMEAGRRLLQRFAGLRLALVTGEAEQERGITRQIQEGWRGLEVVHWDQRPLVELGVLLTGCTGFVGHDSGISHLAAACGVRCHLFFGPTDPAVWAPRNEGVVVLAEPSGDLARLDFERGMAALEAFVWTLHNKK